MVRKRHRPTKAQERLLRLFEQIEDEDIQEVISEVVFIEGMYRSSTRKNFPRQKIRDIVDSVARRQELEENQRSQ